MNKPKKAQVKEFWEWCGLTRFCSPEDDMYHRGIWNDKDGMRIDTPPIDLNNLFEHAVPRVKEVLNYPQEVHGFPGERYKFHGFLTRWIYAIAIQGKDPALALFWAIWEVIHDTG